MHPVLLSIQIDGVKLFKDHSFKINFLNDKRVYTEEVDKHVVEKIGRSVYKQNVMALAGLNASGKTISLKLINYVLNVFISGDRLYRDRSLINIFNSEITFKLVFFAENQVHFVESVARKVVRQSATKGYLSFTEEKILSVDKARVIKKENFLTFPKDNEADAITIRSSLDEEAKRFLKGGSSIVPASIIGSTDEYLSNYVIDTIDETNSNQLKMFSPIAVSHVKYLDPTIEKLELFDFGDKNILANSAVDLKEVYYTLKFQDSEEITVNLLALPNYLSSGTIRGLNMLQRIQEVLHSGGYLIVDELENHFNKIIVQNIINFFKSDVNVHNATLIFSTHYSELLDVIDRKDSIHILRKQDGRIDISNLSELARPYNKDRMEYKNSDLILSGIFDTAPSYEDYWKVNRQLKEWATNGGCLDE